MSLLGGRNTGGDEKAMTVTRLVRRMKNVLEIEVGEIWVEGEISGLRRQASGHCYFTLKDDKAAISCVMFASRARSAGDLLRDGKKVRIFGEVSIYEARGQSQLIVQKVKAAGEGDLQAKFEALKRKLDAEGLFAQNKKKALPKFPRVIGIVSSPTGAALQDMLNILSRRAPWVKVILVGVRVQGAGAEREIARAIRALGDPDKSGMPACDVIITGRGGGSIEDLWNFNEEVLARAIADCPLPVVSAVGHEIDFTISDFVADYRAPTPSAAAEIVVPDREELTDKLLRQSQQLKRLTLGRLHRVSDRLEMIEREWKRRRGGENLLREKIQRIDDLRDRMKEAGDDLIERYEQRFASYRAKLLTHHPERLLERQEHQIELLRGQLNTRVQVALKEKEAKLTRLDGLLRAYGPESAFKRGWSMTVDESGEVVHDPQQLKKGELINTHVEKGIIKSRVEQ